MKKELEPNQVAVGAKMVIKLGEDVINQRFGLNGNEGMAWLSAGAPSDGNFGGGLLYTNKDSVSVGIVATLSDIGHSDLSVPQMLDRFMAHPSIAPYLEGGTPIEYSGHLVPEEGYGMIPELVRDGVLVTGDAAGFCVNLGFTVRGMDFAIESGRLAAESAAGNRSKAVRQPGSNRAGAGMAAGEGTAGNRSKAVRQPGGNHAGAGMAAGEGTLRSGRKNAGHPAARRGFAEPHSAEEKAFGRI